MTPLYTADNTSPAYQLRWSLSIFRRTEIPPPSLWLSELESRVERDAVRILEHRFVPPSTEQFLLSTRPHVAPQEIIKSVKGRLQNLVQDRVPLAFRRNYWLTSLGDANCAAVQQYVANQIGHHRIADPRVRERLAEFQLSCPEVDLTEPQATSHGRFLFNLHVALVHDERFWAADRDWLITTRQMVLAAAKKKGHRLSRMALLPDHLHVVIGCGIAETPKEVVLAYMNNLAFTHGCKRVFMPSWYAGTIGNYDLAAVRRCLERSS